MQLVDSHCHLDDERYEAAGHAVENILTSAADLGVDYIQTISTTRASFAKIHPIALKYNNIFCSFGVHPHHAGEEGVTYDEIIKNGKKPKVIGIGETGLDYFYDNAPREIQRESFKIHLKAARELDLPCIIHTRDAEADTIKIIDEELANGPMKLLFHCFSSQPMLAEYAIEKGIYVSASGIITFKKSEEVREGIAKVPLNLLLVETDAPYLAPAPHRGKTNEPAYTCYVAEKLAEIKGVTLDEIAEVTTDNFFNLFTKATR